MTKIRVHELSKELGIQSKDLMIILNDMGANVKNHMSTVEDEYITQIRSTFFTGSNKGGSRPEKPAPTAPSAKPSAPKPEVKRAASTPARMDVGKPLGQNSSEPAAAKKSAPSPQGKHPVTNGGQRPPAQSGTERPATSGQRPMVQGGAPQKSAAHSGMPQRPTANSGIHQRPIQQGNHPRPSGSAGPRSAAPSMTRPGGPGGPHSGGPHHPGFSPNQRPGEQGGRHPMRSDGQRPAGQGEHRPSPSGNQQRNRNDNRPQFQGGGKPGMGGRMNNNSRPNNNRPNNGGFHGQRNAGRNDKKAQEAPHAPRPLTNVKSVRIPGSITVKEFAQILEVAASEVIKKLIQLGVMATINQEIDIDTAILVGSELGVEVTAAPTQEETLQVEEIEDDPADLLPRWPVVTIMGHVDHGKTSLLDSVRQTNVTASEAGGITQHIGAYLVEIKDKKIAFLDTPGHEAFTAMRARGAQVTDIAVLVVAADDGVMPQTVEAINHAKAAEIPIIVAINKMDKPGANPDRVKQELTEYELVPEEWGGDTIMVPVSAKTKEGIDQLLEMILLVAEMKELKANPNRAAKGTVIEAQLDKGRGPVATVLVQTGTLEVGNVIIAGSVFGRVRVLINDKGKRVKKAGPSVPVEILGLETLPEAGDTFYVVEDERMARQLAAKRQQYKRETELKKNQKITLDDLFDRIKEGEIKELNIVLKADVQGSVEAIRQSLERLSNDEVRVRVIHAGVGAIGDTDVMLASASNAIIIGFNVRPDPMAKKTAEKESVDIRLYRVIYNAIEDVQKAMEGLLEPTFREVVIGRAEVRQTFKVPKVGTIAGSFVVEGKITRNGEARVLRDNVVIFEGKIESLRRFKDDVREVANGFECGIGLERYNDLKEGDIIEVFTMEEVKRTNAG